MKFVVQIKFGSIKKKVESFGSNRYLVYILSKKEEDGAMTEFISLMSKELGTPPSRIHYKYKEGESYVFEVD
ncbi:MAG: hypothetical protein AABW50_04575 [Nanoarchaeota archaeon]|mgnify:CR=1 FL=1